MLQTLYQSPVSDRSLDVLSEYGQLIADFRADKVGEIRIKPLLHQKVDLPQIDNAQIDRQSFGFANLYSLARYGAPKFDLRKTFFNGLVEVSRADVAELYCLQPDADGADF